MTCIVNAYIGSDNKSNNCFQDSCFLLVCHQINTKSNQNLQFFYHIHGIAAISSPILSGFTYIYRTSGWGGRGLWFEIETRHVDYSSSLYLLSFIFLFIPIEKHTPTHPHRELRCVLSSSDSIER